MAQESQLPAPWTPAPELVDWKGTDRFEVVRCIGRGAMGIVYEARDRERRQRVALKTLLHFDPASLFMFKQEFRTLADVQHPNLVRLHEFVATEGERVFFSMELVRGTEFSTYVRKPDAPIGSAGPSDDVRTQPAEAPHSRVQPRSTLPLSDTATGAAGAPPTRSCPADLDRLRPALRQLVEGVQALHSAGKLHRDIKPSNVLVTPEGRVVLLDFGVATDLPRVQDENLREEGQVVGTARYMAPEQAFDMAPTPASDWYSVAVMLYEALVGSPPFQGSACDLIHLKNMLDPLPPSERVTGVAHDLDGLCRALLDRDPAKRPTGPEILHRLGAARASLPAPALRAEWTGTGSLVGREAHLTALRDAFETACTGRLSTVHVGGRAGMGKSALLQHFLDDLVERGEAVALRGRAYERESMPYKAVDTVIDALSRHLMHVSDNDGTLVLPRDMSALARLFPVLRRVPSVEAVTEEPIGDPQRVRRRAFAALRELLSTLSARRPLVLYIDDVQWGDTDSAALLLDLVRPPYAPPILLVLAHREEDEDSSEFLTDLRAQWPAGAEARDVSVGPLEPDDARRLSLALLGSRDAAAETIAEAAAQESGGNPFLVEELTRSSTGRFPGARNTKVTLEQMVSERLAGLPDEARRLAEIVAIGGRPLPVSTIGDAAGIEMTDDMFALLSSHRFVRIGLRDGRELVEPAHDRIRETIVALLSAPVIREHHGRLAGVLEATPGADPEAVAVHLLGAGETERGARFAERAAKEAEGLLAFGQAARLYRLTIDTLPAASQKLGRLREHLGDVLGWAGRSEEAGRAYLAAAEGAPALQRTELERAASEQLLAAGRIQEGGLVLRRVLAHAGVRAPVSPLTAIFWLIVYKLRLKLFGLRFKERNADEVLSEDRLRIDALRAAATGLTSVDVILAACMQARQLVETLRAGDRSQILVAAATYLVHLASRGGPVSKHERAVNDTIAVLAARDPGAQEVSYSRACHAVGVMLRGRWKESVGLIDQAYINVPSQRAGWQTQAALYAVYAQAFLGDLVELRRRHVRMLADADQRGDLFTSVQLRVSHPTVLWLAADDPESARRQTRAAAAQWTQTKFLIQQWQVMRSEAEIELYAGDGAKAYARLEQDARTLKKSRLLGVQYMRGQTAFVRGRAAIASSMGAEPALRNARLAEARQLAKRLERERMPWTAPLAAILTAASANAGGDHARAKASLEAAVDLARAADMALYAAAARYQLGSLLGGDRGAELVTQAEEVMQAQDIRAPARFASMLVPGRWEAKTPPR